MSQQKEAFFVLSLMASSISGGSHYTKFSPNKNAMHKLHNVVVGFWPDSGVEMGPTRLLIIIQVSENQK